jgi:hypothetical protein
VLLLSLLITSNSGIGCFVFGTWFIGFSVLCAGGQFISTASKSETSNHNLFLLLPSLLLDAG